VNKEDALEKIWTDLLMVLNKIVSVYQTILLLSEEKRKVLVAAKPEELEKITKQEETFVLQAGKLEEVRRELVGKILAIHGTPVAKASLEEVKKIATPEVVGQLEVFNTELKRIMAQIAHLNELNTALIQQGLNFINYNINILSQTAVGPTYAPKGESEKQAPKRTMFDAKV